MYFSVCLLRIWVTVDWFSRKIAIRILIPKIFIGWIFKLSDNRFRFPENEKENTDPQLELFVPFSCHAPEIVIRPHSPSPVPFVVCLLCPGVSTQRAEMGLSNSAICALHTYHHVQQLVALLQLHSLLSSGAASQEAPLPSHQGWEQRPDDIMEGQHVSSIMEGGCFCGLNPKP